MVGNSRDNYERLNNDESLGPSVLNAGLQAPINSDHLNFKRNGCKPRLNLCFKHQDHFKEIQAYDCL